MRFRERMGWDGRGADPRISPIVLIASIHKS